MKYSFIVILTISRKYFYMQISAAIIKKNYFSQYCRKYARYFHTNGVHTYFFKVSDYDNWELLEYIFIPNIQISHLVSSISLTVCIIKFMVTDNLIVMKCIFFTLCQLANSIFAKKRYLLQNIYQFKFNNKPIIKCIAINVLSK